MAFEFAFFAFVSCFLLKAEPLLWPSVFVYSVWCAYILVHMFGIIFQFEFNAYFRDTACVAFPHSTIRIPHSRFLFRIPVLPLTSFQFLLLSLLFTFAAIDSVAGKHVSISTTLYNTIEKEALLNMILYAYILMLYPQLELALLLFSVKSILCWSGEHYFLTHAHTHTHT